MFRRGCVLLAQRLVHTQTGVSVGVGRESLALTTGKLAWQADGSVLATYGNLNVLVGTVGDNTMQPTQGVVPLKVEYREKSSAVNAVPRNHMRRELQASDREVLVSRMIDRAVRAFFPDGYYNDTQIIGSVLATDGVHNPDVHTINAASASLALSDIPWSGPIGAVRIARINGAFVINPTTDETLASELDMVYAGSDKGMVMLDVAAKEIPPALFCEAISAAHAAVQPIIAAQRELQQKVGRAKRPLTLIKPAVALMNSAHVLLHDKITAVIRDTTLTKRQLTEAFQEISDFGLSSLSIHFSHTPTLEIQKAVDQLIRQAIRTEALAHAKRVGGRDLSQIRDIQCEVDVFPTLHGSALFSRGETQVLCSAALDSSDASRPIDEVENAFARVASNKNFILSYEYPSYALNTVKHVAARTRREVGHGALAEKAIMAVFPDGFEFTVRVAAEVTSSHGSSSMATVCGASLALMDAGVPITAPVAGISCGVVTAHKTTDSAFAASDTAAAQAPEYCILTDLTGLEDQCGDMDLKLAGTRTGITACQADVKTDGIPLPVLFEAVQRGVTGFGSVLDVMDSVISAPRAALKPNAPVSRVYPVPRGKKGLMIGPGGKTIRDISMATNAKIVVLETDEYRVFAPSLAQVEEAVRLVNEAIAGDDRPDPRQRPDRPDRPPRGDRGDREGRPERRGPHPKEALVMHEEYVATVREVRPYGVIVEFQGVKALLHQSQMNKARPQPLDVDNTIKIKFLGLQENGHTIIKEVVEGSS